MLKQMNLFSNNSQKNEKKPEQGDLNSNQLDQINYAKSLNLSEEFIRELEKHPEWSSTLMNYVIIKMKNKKSYNEVIDFLTEYEPQDTEKIEIGKDLGLIMIVDIIIEEGLLHKVIDPLVNKNLLYKAINPLAKEKSCKEINWLLKFKYYNYKCQTDVLESGRVCINEITNNLDALLALMSEGVFEAVKLLERLGRIQVQSSNNFGMESITLFQGIFSISTMLDDMNIRGQQILDAYQYADESAEDLFRLILVRDDKMIRFINAMSAERFKNLIFQSTDEPLEFLAVNSGASFRRKKSNIFNDGFGFSFDREFKFSPDPDLRVTLSNCNEYLDDNITKLNKDYSKMDIYDKTPLNEAIKIAEAHGFRLLEKCEQQNNYDELYSVLMYKDDTCDFLYASAKDDNFYYNGCRINAVRLDDYYVTDKSPLVMCNTSRFKQKFGDRLLQGRYYSMEFANDKSIFREYNKLNQDINLDNNKKYPIDWSQVEYGYFTGPIIPGYAHISYYTSQFSLEDVTSYQNIIRLERHYLNINNMINFFIFIEHLAKNKDEWGVEAYSYLYENRFSIFPQSIVASIYSPYDFSFFIRIAFEYCKREFNMPMEEMNNYVEELKRFYIKDKEEKDGNKKTLFPSSAMGKMTKSDLDKLNWYPDDESNKIMKRLLAERR